MGRILPCAAVLLWTPILLAGCAAPDDGTRIADTVSLPGAGQGWHEVDVIMAAGARISWSWQAEAAGTVPGGPDDSDGEEPRLHFDVHRHHDGRVEHLFVDSSARHDGKFTAEESGEYSLYWRNPGQEEVLLSYEVRGMFELLDTPT